MPVRLYEAMYIVRPEATDEDLQGLMGRVADTIGQIGGTIDLHDVWERRELAYDIDGCRRGTYVICYFNAESTAIDALRHEMDLEELVLRYVAVIANPKAIWRPVSAAPPEEAEEATEEAAPAEAENEAASAAEEPAAEAPAAEEAAAEAPAAEAPTAEAEEAPAE